MERLEPQTRPMPNHQNYNNNQQRPQKPRTTSQGSQGGPGGGGYEGGPGAFQGGGGRQSFDAGVVYQGGYGGAQGGGGQHNHHPAPQQYQQHFPGQPIYPAPGQFHQQQQQYAAMMAAGMIPQQYMQVVNNPQMAQVYQYGVRPAFYPGNQPMMMPQGANQQVMPGMVPQNVGVPNASFQQQPGPGPQGAPPPNPAHAGPAPGGMVAAPAGPKPADASGAEQRRYYNDRLLTAEEYAAQTAHQPKAVPVPAPTERKKNVLVFVNPDTNQTVDIPQKTEAEAKAKAVAPVVPAAAAPPASTVSRDSSGPRLSESESTAAAEEVKNEFQRKVAELTRHTAGTSKEVSTTSSRASPALSVSSEIGGQNGVPTEGSRKLSSQAAPGEAVLGERKPSIPVETKTEVRSSPEKSDKMEMEVVAPVRPVATQLPPPPEKMEMRITSPATLREASPAAAASPPVVPSQTSPQPPQPPAPAAVEEVKIVEEPDDRFQDGAQSPTENGTKEEHQRRHSVNDPSAVRKTYSRDMLLSLEQRGHHTFSQEVALKLSEIIKQGTPGGGNRPEMYGRQPSRGGPGGGGGHQQRIPGTSTPRGGQQVIHLQLQTEAIIPTNENAWKPMNKKKENLDENEKVLLDVRALLNKITPSNYGKLIEDMKRMPFNETAERLGSTVGLIFDKALEEITYAEFYAMMCRDLIHVEAKDASGQPVKFRTVVLRQSQNYFEKTEREENEAEEDKSEDDPEALQEKRGRAKRHYLGNIRFISELYKVEMLTDRVILSCFQKLLPKSKTFEDVDEDKVECLCKLLQTCAVKIKEQNTVDVFFQQLRKMIDAKVTSSRIRFLMEDTIDLKNNNYVPRKTTTAKPTTIKEVHAAKQKEEQEIKQAVADAAILMPPRQQMPTRGGMAMGRGGLMPQSGRGLTKPSSVPHALSSMGGGQPPRHGGRPAVQPMMDGGKRKVLGLLADPSHGHTTMLGPQGGLGTGRPSWGAGSGGGLGMRGSASTARLPENKSASSSRESSVNRMNPRGSLTHTPTFPEDTSVERSATPLASGTATPSQMAGTPSRGSPVQEDQELDADAVTEKANVMLTQATNLDGEESREVILDSVRILRRWTGPTKASFIKSVMEKSFEAKSRDREKYVEFLSGMAREGLFSQDVLTDGMGQIVEAADDIAVDVPEMYAYTADLIGPLLADNLLSLAALDSVLSKSPAHIPKYHGAFRKWLDARLSPEQKEEMINRDPVVGQKILGSS
ncbi:eukaryotic translation initiation factor 4 gamma 1-like isoform X2 [Paramacrobiotus metropolitanus]|nr:eukaryotic translation initiation factor 4 gamma 1-like isoform X2 [Paramacrobiotus metropolitanus]